MKLYTGPTSPFGRKVKVVALELGIDVGEATIEVATAEFLDALNPLRKIPTLVLDDGTVLHDSAVICAYLNAIGGDHDLVPAGERWAVETRVALANGLMEAVLQHRMEQARPDEEQSAGFIAKLEARVARVLPHLEASAPVIAAGSLRLDQIATACALEYVDFRHPHHWRATCPRLAAWLADFSRRPSMLASRPADAGVDRPPSTGTSGPGTARLPA